MRFGSIDVYFVSKNNRCRKFGDHHSLVMASLSNDPQKCFPSGNDFGIVFSY